MTDYKKIVQGKDYYEIRSENDKWQDITRNHQKCLIELRF